MASEPDDNPFARNSAWPKMPQAPFRVGPLPKAGASTPTAETELQPPSDTPPPPEPPRTITPLFFRPIEPQAAPNLAMGGAGPPAPAPAVAAPAPAGARADPPPAQPAPPPLPPQPAVATPAPFEPEAVELAEIVVTPLRAAGPKPKLRRKRSPFAA